MIRNEYKKSHGNHTLFVKHQEGKVTALVSYIGDIVVTCNDHNEIKGLRNYLEKEFEIKDLG